jgi:hypothetical protein
LKIKYFCLKLILLKIEKSNKFEFFLLEILKI